MTIHWKAVEQYFTVVLFVNPLTSRVKPLVIQSFLSFDTMDGTRRKAVEQYLIIELFVFQFYPVSCNFGKFINFVLGTVRSER